MVPGEHVLGVFRLKTAPLALHVIEILIPKADEIFLSELPVEGAAQAFIRIRRTKEQLTLTVRDDGKRLAQGSTPRRVRWGASVLPASRSAHNGSAGERRFTPHLDRVTTVTIEINSEGRTMSDEIRVVIADDHQSSAKDCARSLKKSLT
jgi:hypothetical protein